MMICSHTQRWVIVIWRRYPLTYIHMCHPTHKVAGMHEKPGPIFKKWRIIMDLPQPSYGVAKTPTLLWSFRYCPATVAERLHCMRPWLHNPWVGGRCVGVTSHSSQHPCIRFPSLVSVTQPFHLRLGPLQDQHLLTILKWLALTLLLERLDQVAGMREKPWLI